MDGRMDSIDSLGEDEACRLLVQAHRTGKWNSIGKYAPPNNSLLRTVLRRYWPYVSEQYHNMPLFQDCRAVTKTVSTKPRNLESIY